MSITVTGGGGSGGTTGTGSTGINDNYVDVLVGQGTITLTQGKQLKAGTLSPETLVERGEITPDQYAALTGHAWTGHDLVKEAVLWTPNLRPGDYELVFFNGILYQARGNVPPGVVPPVEVAA